MVDLKLDLEELNDAVQHLRHAESAFADSDRRAGHAAAAVGHAGLATTLVDFSDKWDLQRADLLTSVRAVRQSLDTIRDGFLEAERDLLRMITNGAK